MKNDSPFTAFSPANNIRSELTLTAKLFSQAAKYRTAFNEKPSALPV